jgi:hypothetical protein
MNATNDTGLPLGITDEEQFEIERAEAKKLRELAKKRKRDADESSNTTPVKMENHTPVNPAIAVMVVQKCTLFDKVTNVIVGNAAFAKVKLEGTFLYSFALCNFVYNKCNHFITYN